MFVPLGTFQLRLIFLSKPEPTKVKPLSGSPGLTPKHLNRLERHARYKHSRFLQKVINYGLPMTNALAYLDTGVHCKKLPLDPGNNRRGPNVIKVFTVVI